MTPRALACGGPTATCVHPKARRPPAAVPLEAHTGPLQAYTRPWKASKSPLQFFKSPNQDSRSPIQEHTRPFHITNCPNQAHTRPLPAPRSPIQAHTRHSQPSRSPLVQSPKSLRAAQDTTRRTLSKSNDHSPLILTDIHSSTHSTAATSIAAAAMLCYVSEPLQLRLRGY